MMSFSDQVWPMQPTERGMRSRCLGCQFSMSSHMHVVTELAEKFGSGQWCCGSCALATVGTPGAWFHGSRCEGEEHTGEESVEEAKARMVEIFKVHTHQLALWDALLTSNLLTSNLLMKKDDPVEPGTDVQDALLTSNLLTKMDEPVEPGTDMQED